MITFMRLQRAMVTGKLLVEVFLGFGSRGPAGRSPGVFDPFAKAVTLKRQ